MCSVPTHTHTSHVSTLVVSHDAPVPLEKFERWVSDIIWDEDSPMEIFRMKGIVNVDGSSRKHLLQVVHDLFELVELDTRDAEWADGEERSTRVVVIGRYLDGAVLRQKLLHWVA